jgi:hypothetical protein
MSSHETTVAGPARYLERRDKVLQAFLARQLEQGLALAAQSDVLKVTPIGGMPPQHFLAEFHCRGAARMRSGEIVVSRRRHVVGVFFPDDYLRRAEVPQVLTWLAPANIASPHIAPPFICTGRINPGTPLVDLLYQIYEIIIFFRVRPREDDALSKWVCSWTRAHLADFPLDRTPLKRPAKSAAALFPEKEVN